MSSIQHGLEVLHGLFPRHPCRLYMCLKMALRGLADND
jgi:hypothetical protein